MSHPLDPSLAENVGFEILDEYLARDVLAALAAARTAGVVFAAGATPLGIFRDAVSTAISRIHTNGRAPFFLRFLTEGPYDDGGEIPHALRNPRLSDAETASVVAFIYGHMVNCFKGALTELLAVAPCLQVLRTLKEEGRLPDTARLYVGDAVMAAARKGTRHLKAADLHLLTESPLTDGRASVDVNGVVEVKSYFRPQEKLVRQLDQHLMRARRGLRVLGRSYPPESVQIGADQHVVRITVAPARWELPRTIRFEFKGGRKFLHGDPAVPPAVCDQIERVGPAEWRITLRWSKEALDAAGFGMSFWFMEKVGEAVYAGAVPKDWTGMTPAEAGKNAAKMMLYYAILRSGSLREEQRAIALYNSYSFGPALGLNFRNSKGKREMLCPEHLEEILANGVTKDGWRVS